MINLFKSNFVFFAFGKGASVKNTNFGQNYFRAQSLHLELLGHTSVKVFKKLLMTN